MSEVPQFPWWLTLSFAAWAAIGPLVGLLVGHLLTRSWQRQQWLMDNKKQEYRELMSALTKNYGILAQYKAPMVALDGMTQRRIAEAEGEALQILRDRIFIRKEVEDANVQALW